MRQTNVTTSYVRSRINPLPLPSTGLVAWCSQLVDISWHVSATNSTHNAMQSNQILEKTGTMRMGIGHNDPNRYSPTPEVEDPSRQTSTEREQQADRTDADERYDSDNDRGMNPDMDRPNLRTNSTITNLNEGYGNRGADDANTQTGSGSRQQHGVDQDDDTRNRPIHQDDANDASKGGSMGREGSRGGYGSGEEAAID